MKKLTVTNTLFVHLIVWDDRYVDPYSDGFLKNLLKSIFHEYASFYAQVILIQPPGGFRFTTEPIFNDEMTIVRPKNETSIDSQTLLICERRRFIPKTIFYRSAV